MDQLGLVGGVDSLCEGVVVTIASIVVSNNRNARSRNSGEY
jgi:hypothetical protein